MQVSQFMASHAPQPSTFSQENPQNSQNGLNGHQPEPASDNKATNGSSAPAASGPGKEKGVAAGFRALDVESVKHYLAGKPALAACLGDPKDAASWQVQLPGQDLNMHKAHGGCMAGQSLGFVVPGTRSGEADHTATCPACLSGGSYAWRRLRPAALDFRACPCKVCSTVARCLQLPQGLLLMITGTLAMHATLL